MIYDDRGTHTEHDAALMAREAADLDYEPPYSPSDLDDMRRTARERWDAEVEALADRIEGLIA